MKTETKKKIFLVFLYAALLYFWFTCMVYRFLHPQMTNTQLMMKFHRALILDFNPEDD